MACSESLWQCQSPTEGLGIVLLSSRTLAHAVCEGHKRVTGTSLNKAAQLTSPLSHSEIFRRKRDKKVDFILSLSMAMLLPIAVRKESTGCKFVIASPFVLVRIKSYHPPTDSAYREQ